MSINCSCLLQLPITAQNSGYPCFSRLKVLLDGTGSSAHLEAMEKLAGMQITNTDLQAREFFNQH